MNLVFYVYTQFIVLLLFMAIYTDDYNLGILNYMFYLSYIASQFLLIYSV